MTRTIATINFDITEQFVEAVEFRLRMRAMSIEDIITADEQCDRIDASACFVRQALSVLYHRGRVTPARVQDGVTCWRQTTEIERTRL